MSAPPSSHRLRAFTTLALATWGCVPVVDEDPSRVSEGQVLAVRFEPAEVAPKSMASVSALVVGATDAGFDEVQFELCMTRKALSELGPVAPECVAEGSTKASAAQLIGSGVGVEFAVPEDACRMFGPLRPKAEPGQPPGRPADPDPTGGYYQPVIARANNTALGGLRLNCGLPGASQEQVAEYNRNFVPNDNPKIGSVKLRAGGGNWRSIELEDDEGLSVPRDATITIRTEWSTPEKYRLLASEDRELVTREERYLVSFFSDVGGFETLRTNANTRGIGEATWRSPPDRGRVRLWTVARDGRGGTGWATFVVTVD